MTLVETRDEQSKRQLTQDGFTMVELFIVILVLGVLAAITLPTFLTQKQRGFDAQMKTSLRTIAAYEESYVVDNPRYATMAELVTEGGEIMPVTGVEVALLRYAADGFCLEATHVGSGKRWYWDSQAGGLQPKDAPGCPATTTGAAGDSLP